MSSPAKEAPPALKASQSGVAGKMGLRTKSSHLPCPVSLSLGPLPCAYLHITGCKYFVFWKQGRGQLQLLVHHQGKAEVPERLSPIEPCLMLISAIHHLSKKYIYLLAVAWESSGLRT